VTEALVDEGFTMKRYRPRAQGRGYEILKRSSQISVTLSDDKNYRPLSKEAQRKLAKLAPVVEVEKKSETAAEAAPAKKAPANKSTAKKATAKKASAKKAAPKAKKEAK
jgi:large subunit ribosomal protein L22